MLSSLDYFVNEPSSATPIEVCPVTKSPDRSFKLRRLVILTSYSPQDSQRQASKRSKLDDDNV